MVDENNLTLRILGHNYGRDDSRIEHVAAINILVCVSMQSALLKKNLQDGNTTPGDVKPSVMMSAPLPLSRMSVMEA